MGVDFVCDDHSFSCSYSTWSSIRVNVIKATFAYLESKFEEDMDEFEDIPDEYDQHKMALLEMMASVNNSDKNQMLTDVENNLIINLVLACKKMSPNVVNALIYFDIIGLFALCNKGDCEGFYSVGNSIDICQLLDLIEPFIKDNKEEYDFSHSCIYEYDECVFNLFEESATKKMKIVIG